jgi:hypothetical protein
VKRRERRNILFESKIGSISEVSAINSKKQCERGGRREGGREGEGGRGRSEGR